MPNLTTTLRVIDSYEICQEGWDAICKTAGSDELDTEITLLQMLDADGVDGALWALRCWPEELSLYHFRADVADLVSHIYRDKYQSDTRVDDCIAMMHKYADGDATREELDAASVRARAAARAVAAAAARAAVAAWAADTAAWAAEAAAWEAEAEAMAAEAAVWEAATWADWSAAAMWAAWSSDESERVDTYKKIEKLLRGYIEREC